MLPREIVLAGGPVYPNAREKIAERKGHIGEMRALLDKAETEKRNLSRDEELRFQDLKSKADVIESWLSESQRKPHTPTPGGGFSSDDNEIRMLKPEEKLSEHVRSRSYGDGMDGGDSLNLGRFVKGVVTGNWKGAESEKRALQIGDDTLGGYLVPSPLALQIIDMARNASVVMKSGALTIPMESNTLDLAKILEDPTAYWRGENQTITPSDMSFGKLTLRARTLAALVKVSVEVIEDAVNLDQIVSSALSQALALEPVSYTHLTLPTTPYV